MAAKGKIMILGGGENQVPLIECALKAGYDAVVCDWDPACPGAKLHVRFRKISIYDRDALLAAAQEEEVDGIVTNSEPTLHIVSELTDRMGLPSVPVEVEERYLNKGMMRDWLAGQGLSDVKYRICGCAEEAVQAYRSLGLRKAVIKPLDNSASRGVFTVLSEEDITRHFQEAIQGNRRQSEVLLEEYIQGTEFTVDGLCVGGRHTTLAISRKKHYPGNENVACELLFSHQDGEFDYDALRELNDRVVTAGGLPFGMTHAEYKYADGKYHLIEVAARGGGSFISTLMVPYLAGYDTVKVLLDCAAGRYAGEELSVRPAAKGRQAVLKFFSSPGEKSGYVTGITGLELLDAHPGIVKYELPLHVGDPICPAQDDAHRIGYYIAFADSGEKLREIMDYVDGTFRLEIREDV